MNYGQQLLRILREVRLSDGEEVSTAAYTKSGMPYVGLTDLSHLPNICRDAGDKTDEVHLPVACIMTPFRHFIYAVDT